MRLDCYAILPKLPADVRKRVVASVDFSVFGALYSCGVDCHVLLSQLRCAWEGQPLRLCIGCLGFLVRASSS